MIGLLALCAPPARAQGPDGDARLFQTRCAACHQPAKLRPYLARRPDDATRAADLDAFLAKHHARDASERQAIIRWLLSQQTP